MFFVYVLKSEKDDSTYIGFTQDLEKRLLEHNAGKTKSIKHKLPMTLEYYEAVHSKTIARKREIELKKNSFAKEQLYKRIFI